MTEVPDGWLAVVEAAEEDYQMYPKLEALDIFGGEGRLADCLIDSGLNAVKYEIADMMEEEDILSLQAWIGSL